MLNLLFDCGLTNKYVALGFFLAFLVTFLALKYFTKYLPHDAGRAFAVNGELSKGKPRGTGLLFVSIFVVTVLIFVPFSFEFLIYCILILAEMLTGYLDDRAKKPWGELKKGIFDLCVALACSITFVAFAPTLSISFFRLSIELPAVVYVILATLLILVSINVTNCTDGVDGLSSTVGIVTLFSFYFVSNYFDSVVVLFMIACLLAYLGFNASPSKLLMGDAGSRALGIFIAIVALRTGAPLLFIPLALVYIVDGGLGLIKITLIRLTKKKNIMNKFTFPLHDHVRKKLGWSDTQTVLRFAIFQAVISILTITLI